MKTEWKYIILFILIAFGLSFPIHKGYLNDFFNSLTRKTIFYESEYLLAGTSTLLAAILALTIHKNLSNKITILGDDKIKNLLILCLPIIAFSISGLNNNLGLNKYLYGFYFASISILYAFTEEFGWRRYLQNALEGLNKNVKYFFIGVIWWIWHFRFNTQFDFYIFPFICIGGGFLLGKLADDIKSILPVVAMHTVIILITNSGKLDNQKIIGTVLVIVGWVMIEQIWKRKEVNNKVHSDQLG
jgi:membrane protease YdiL (CAAX protease family)